MKKPLDVHIGQKFILNRDYRGYSRGELVTLVVNDDSDCPQFSTCCGGIMCLTYDDLVPAVGLDVIEVGDVLENGSWFRRKVLAIMGKYYLLSKGGEFLYAECWWSQEDIKQNGYDLEDKQDSINAGALTRMIRRAKQGERDRMAAEIAAYSSLSVEQTEDLIKLVRENEEE